MAAPEFRSILERVRDSIARLFSKDRRAQMEERLSDEMRFHVEMAAQRNVTNGMDAEEAQRAAYVAFGGHTRWQESTRDAYRSRYAEELVQDVRYALRGLAQSPAFTFAAVATLALSVGATTSMFSVVNAVLLRSLPYPNPDRIVVICERNAEYPNPCNTLNPGNYLAWHDEAKSFSATAAFVETSVSLTGGGSEPVSAHASYVTASMFPIFGARAAVGRFFTEDEDRPDAPRVAVLSQAFWRQQYAGDRSIVGKTISVNANEVTVVGVAEPSFFSFEPVDLWLPMRFTPAQRTGPGRYLHGVARLRDGVSIDAAGREMTTIMSRRVHESPETNTNWSALVLPLRESLVGDARSALWVLLGAVAFLLVIACANVANLLLARAADRQREVAVRISLGASPSRIVRQLLTESIVLSVGASALGLAIAIEGTHALVALVPDGMSLLAHSDVSVDWRVLSFTAAMAIVTGIAFGLAPAAQVARTDVQTTLRQGGRGGASDSRASARVRGALVVAEMSLAMVLLAGAGLMVRSFSALERVTLGFDPSHVLTASASLPRKSYPNDTVRVAFFQAAEARLAALPGVRSVGAISYLPLSGQRSASGFNVEGRAPFPPGQEALGDMRAVTPGYFQSMGIGIKQGRALTNADVENGPAVGVVSETLAHKFWPNESAVGHYLLYEWNGNERVEIVGVAADVHHEGADKSALMEIYRPLAQFPYAEMSLVMRVSGNPLTYGAAMRDAIKQVDPNVPLAEMSSMEGLVDKSFGRSRLSTALFGLFGVLGLVLAAIGIYGVMSYTVEQRRREIGIRMALGAKPAAMVRSVVMRGAVLAGWGIVVGAVGALVLTRFMRALLFGVAPGDQATFVVVASILALVGLVAAWVPGRRATRIDPVAVLRGE